MSFFPQVKTVGSARRSTTIRKQLLFCVLVIVAATLAVGLNVIDFASGQIEAFLNPQSARVGAVTIRAEGRGKPLYNFRDGKRIAVDFRGQEAGIKALRSGLAEARSLSSGDLDANGTPDVVAGYGYNGTGIITIQRGNPDAYAF